MLTVTRTHKGKRERQESATSQREGEIWKMAESLMLLQASSSNLDPVSDCQECNNRLLGASIYQALFEQVMPDQLQISDPRHDRSNEADYRRSRSASPHIGDPTSRCSDTATALSSTADKSPSCTHRQDSPVTLIDTHHAILMMMGMMMMDGNGNNSSDAKEEQNGNTHGDPKRPDRGVECDRGDGPVYKYDPNPLLLNSTNNNHSTEPWQRYASSWSMQPMIPPPPPNMMTHISSPSSPQMTISSVIQRRRIDHHMDAARSSPCPAVKRCSNCGATTTPSWRRCPEGKALLCNACGLYQKLHKRPRPVTVDEDGNVRVARDRQINFAATAGCPGGTPKTQSLLSDQSGLAHAANPHQPCEYPPMSGPSAADFLAVLQAINEDSGHHGLEK